MPCKQWVAGSIPADGSKTKMNKGIVVVSGSRDFSDAVFANTCILKLRKEFGDSLTIVSGDAKHGVDRMTISMCEDFGITHIKCPANWKKFGRSAGIIRNRFMLSFFEPELVVGIYWDLTPGTKHCLEEAEKRNIKVRRCVPEKENER